MKRAPLEAAIRSDANLQMQLRLQRQMMLDAMAGGQALRNDQLRQRQLDNQDRRLQASDARQTQLVKYQETTQRIEQARQTQLQSVTNAMLHTAKSLVEQGQEQ